MFSSAILVHIVKCKVVVLFLAHVIFKFFKFYLKIRFTTFKVLTCKLYISCSSI